MVTWVGRGFNGMDLDLCGRGVLLVLVWYRPRVDWTWRQVLG